LPVGETRRDFGVVDIEIEATRIDIEHDGIAVAHCGNGSADGCFGRNVPRHEAVGRAGEAAVGEESDGFAEARAHEGGGYAQHLAHARSAAWALVTDDDDIAFPDAAVLHGVKGVLFPIEGTCWTAVHAASATGDFHDATVGREVAAQDGETAGGMNRRLRIMHDILA
jgi:hypothetical protein